MQLQERFTGAPAALLMARQSRAPPQRTTFGGKMMVLTP
jgi:hypothetical protein